MPIPVRIVALLVFASTSTPAPAPAFTSTPPAAPAPPTAACGEGETAVVIDTRAHQMHLCHAGKVERTFAVALGSRGVGKQHQGDNRTPLGRYGLGPPRASKGFHIFVPVNYPTPAQARMGFTGSAIGIHGPPRGYETLAQLAMLVAQDWTAGCIAVATDADIEAVAAWLRTRSVKDVRLVV
jgi:L,D-peptidoglycan transpeptidase YkuD (ErfK/YbiS/YcfS/YnhG family)